MGQPETNDDLGLGVDWHLGRRDSAERVLTWGVIGIFALMGAAPFLSTVRAVVTAALGGAGPDPRTVGSTLFMSSLMFSLSVVIYRFLARNQRGRWVPLRERLTQKRGALRGRLYGRTRWLWSIHGYVSRPVVALRTKHELLLVEHGWRPIVVPIALLVPVLYASVLGVEILTVKQMWWAVGLTAFVLCRRIDAHALRLDEVGAFTLDGRDVHFHPAEPGALGPMFTFTADWADDASRLYELMDRAQHEYHPPKLLEPAVGVRARLTSALARLHGTRAA